MRWQTCVAAVVPILVLAAGLCEAQTDGQGFLLVGAGGYSNTYSSGRVHQLVVGGEAITPQNIGLGGEVELAAGGGDAWFALSVNATRHLLQRSDGRATPFLTAGYTRLITLTEQRGRNAVNVGMGARYAVTHRNSSARTPRPDLSRRRTDKRVDRQSGPRVEVAIIECACQH